MNDWTQAWRKATVHAQRAVARGTQATELELRDDLPFPFEAGHVVALRAEASAGLIRHPYTVCGVNPKERRLTFVYRVIPEGRLTPTFAHLPAGAEVELSGLHHAPIREEIDPAASHFVGLATSSGLGPLWGYADQALASGEARPIHLVVGVREEADLPLLAEMTTLAERHPTFRFTPTLSQPSPEWSGLRGRIQDHAPGLIGGLEGAHVHLVGNMAMVKTLESALVAAGVAPGRVTKEGFFNWNAEVDPLEVAALASRLRLKNG